MSRKSFFWPVLSEEEKRRKAESEHGVQQQALGPAAVQAPPPQVPVMPQQAGPEQNNRRGPNLPPLPSTPMMPSAPVMPSNPVTPSVGGAATSGSESEPRPETFSAAPVAQPQDTLLVLDAISRAYDQADNHLVVLDEASLTVKAGEMVALVAPSGAGKSTLLHIAGLLERPDAGEVYIAGAPQSMAADRARTLMRRSEIGFVYQFHHLLPEFSALENVTMPQLINGQKPTEARERAMALLSYLKVDHRADHRPAELSGGEQQRVAIARAMANAPRVLLADEPTGNLDPTTSDYVFKALNSLVKQSGIAALVATHNLFLADRMDRQITLSEGKVVEL